MANKLIIDGEVCFGSTSSASSVICKDNNGNNSTVQSELDKIDDKIVNELEQLRAELNLLKQNIQTSKIGFVDYNNPLVYNQKLNATSSSSSTPPVNTYTATVDCQAIINLQVDANNSYTIKIAINGKNIIHDGSVVSNRLQSYTVVPLYLRAGDVLTMSVITNMSTSTYSIFPII